MQLEHNVHEPLGIMPTLQIEHSSEHSQAFQDLTNSDSPVTSNIGYTGSDQAQSVIPSALVAPGDPSLDMLLQMSSPKGLLCGILDIGLWASVTPVILQTMNIQSTDHSRLGLML